jgi:dTDP-4-amino-4,6-dideoxygalactose transaminase
MMRRLMAEGIATRRGVMASHEEGAYGDRRFGAPLEHTEAAARDALMLPLFPGLTDQQQDYVIERIATHAVSQAA